MSTNKKYLLFNGHLILKGGKEMKTIETPETKLWTAVLIQAIEDLRDSKGAQSEHWNRDAQVWFKDKSNKMGSFNWICDMLDLDNQTRKEMRL
jgi:hypothetical protein